MASILRSASCTPTASVSRVTSCLLRPPSPFGDLAHPWPVPRIRRSARSISRAMSCALPEGVPCAASRAPQDGILRMVSRALRRPYGYSRFTEWRPQVAYYTVTRGISHAHTHTLGISCDHGRRYARSLSRAERTPRLRLTHMLTRRLAPLASVSVWRVPGARLHGARKGQRLVAIRPRASLLGAPRPTCRCRRSTAEYPRPVFW